jgi:YVTN family beta-propeller protein
MNTLGWCNLIICLLLAFHNIILGAQTKAVSGYHLTKQVMLGGEGGWDYLTLDSKARRLYIARSSHVMVLDADSGKIVGDIPNTAGVHGIALVSELNRGFTSNGHASTVTVFDIKTLKVLNQIPVGKNPDAIIYDPASRHIFTFNGASRDATVIDPESKTVVGTIPLDGRPEFAVSDGKGHIYVNIEDKSMVAELDSYRLTVEARWPLAPGEKPTGITMDRNHRRLFIGCANKLMVIMNADNGHIITTLPIGGGVDATAFGEVTSMVFSSNGEGTLTVILEDSPDKFSVVGDVVTQKGARTMALDPKTQSIYLVTAEFGPSPSPTPNKPHPRPSVVPGTFRLLVVSRTVS